MGIYFFDRTNGIELIRDEVGQHLSDREASRLHAQSLLSEMAQEQLPDGHRRDFVVDVRDNLGILIYTCVLALSGRWLDFSLPPHGDRVSVFQN